MSQAELSFQDRVWNWFKACFTDPSTRNTKERTFRFFEESTELAQSLGVTKEECLKLVEYVYGRPVGLPQQEIGGVMLTLHALCSNESYDCQYWAETELRRVSDPGMILKIREKQVSKRLLMT